MSKIKVSNPVVFFMYMRDKSYEYREDDLQQQLSDLIPVLEHIGLSCDNTYYPDNFVKSEVSEKGQQYYNDLSDLDFTNLSLKTDHSTYCTLALIFGCTKASSYFNELK